MTENISFSKEMKMRAGGFDPIGYWEGIFRENCIILKIVQDADRFFASGLIGIERCIQYNRREILKMYGREPTPLETYKIVKEHYDDKLSKLQDYAMTEPGKAALNSARIELDFHLNKMKKSVGM